ncbi:hypothetical protein [Micromonospora sp. CB01531]|uniref:hypothetical protein n=1 Tax=Micromonospora sp. CB01531 TaxID=1718947 RepID=UPI0011610D62|nr:hypothetical protein [Micromonospora sp. CB01531]
MAADTPNDSSLFEIPPQQLLSAIRTAASGGDVEPIPKYLLARCGLLGESQLTDAGLALFKLAWVMRKDKEANQALGQALRQLNPLQVIEQELRGLGPVPEDGVLDLLHQHRAVSTETTVTDIRPTLRWLSGVGLLAYSTKLKTVRSLAPAPDAALAGEVQAIASMISPRTPFLNVVKLRRVIRPLKGVVWWADPHFGARALEELAEELRLEDVTEIRIISGDAENVISNKSLKDFERFQQEMSNYNIVAQWRVDRRGVRDWHDRWLGDDKVVWNVPPINTLFKNDYSEISPTSERPPFDQWWRRATPR